MDWKYRGCNTTKNETCERRKSFVVGNHQCKRQQGPVDRSLDWASGDWESDPGFATGLISLSFSVPVFLSFVHLDHLDCMLFEAGSLSYYVFVQCLSKQGPDLDWFLWAPM